MRILNINQLPYSGMSSDVEMCHPSRLIVRDAELWVEDPEVDFSNTDLPFTEK